MSKEYKEVRCQGEREHVVNGINYCECGSLLVGIDKSVLCDILVKCKYCKTTWNIICIDNDVQLIKQYNAIELKKG
jgi:hypothetical protein